MALSQSEVEEFAEIMAYKCKIFDYSMINDADERLRAQAAQVIVDTELLLDGTVPLEVWRKSFAEVTRERGEA